MKPYLPLFIASTVALSACVSNESTQTISTKKAPTSSTARAEQPYLTQEQAALRSERVSDVSYVLDFKLDGSESFSATSIAQFELSDNASDLTIDLNKADLKQVIVNGKTIEPQYNQWFITIPSANLVKGRNTVSVEFTRKHSTNGEGLHRFVDPVDNNVYLYSHFEPAAAHQMFALFDQPDLKANYQMTVTAPKGWHVFSAMKESSFEQQGDNTVWQFDNTLKLSPYNFSLHAGPYHMWEDNSGKYPMRLFARQSVAKQVTPTDWFTYTKQGIGFFENYYGIDYPFRKYDQVLVPDFLYGAMENAAAITFAERGFLTNGEMNASQRNRLASVILHEMAHQWFGNLVTMKWWNGLWLNESFAAFMATLATAEATEFTNAWQSFYAFGKQSAYRQDQQITTHPIEVAIPSTANAFDNIDAITYSKGASTLKQLTHLLGAETFRKGVHNYLSKFAYKNAELDNLIDNLSQASNRDLSQWKQEWLYQAGVNTITASFQCEGDVISEFTINQTADEKFPTLREQRVQVALYKSAKNTLTLNHVEAITYKGSSTSVESLKGQQCPDLVYPNYQDWGFVKVNLDGKSFGTAKSHLSFVDDTLQRSMLWQSLFDSALDANLPLNDYLDIAIQNVANETDYTVLGQVLSQISQVKAALDVILGSDHPYVVTTNERLEMLTWHNTLANKDDKNKLTRWFGYYRNFAASPSALATLNDLLAGKKSIENLTIDQDQRWDIIAQLNRYNAQGSEALIEKELATDNSDTGQKSALSAQVIRPDAAIKKQWLDKIIAENSDVPFPKLRLAMASLYTAEQNTLSEQTAELRLAQLPLLDKRNDHTFMRSYAGSLIPANCTTESVARLATAIDSMVDLSNGARRALLVTHQNDQRCLAIKNILTVK